METNNNNQNETSIFTPGEEVILASNMERRELMLKELFVDGSPKKSGDMRVAKEIIETMDGAILTTAKIRKDAEKQKDDTKTNQLVLAAIMQSAHDSKKVFDGEIVDALPDSCVPTDIVDGELEDGVNQLALIDFIDPKDEE